MSNLRINMKAKVIKPKIEASTEDKIKEAARKLFTQKGYAATRTRDIAEEAGINLALVNYYFRSKEKLFDIIMLENMQGMIKSVLVVINNETTSLEEKLEAMVSNYIDHLIRQPEIPLFMLSELRTNPEELFAKLGIKEQLFQSHFMKQMQEAMMAGKMKAIHPLHFMMNLIGMTVFPFVASPMICDLGNLDTDSFNELMKERKELIPVWIKTIMEIK